MYYHKKYKKYKMKYVLLKNEMSIYGGSSNQDLVRGSSNKEGRNNTRENNEDNFIESVAVGKESDNSGFSENTFGIIFDNDFDCYGLGLEVECGPIKMSYINSALKTEWGEKINEIIGILKKAKKNKTDIRDCKTKL